MTAVAANLTQSVGFDAEAVRRDFPILSLESRGRPLVYLDNGATTQKPRLVIDAIRNYYEKQNANIHRGVYELSQIATEGYEKARRIVQRFINAADPAEIIFTRGTTESINLVASSWGRAFLSEGDEVVVSALEHHSNIVPWQMICQQTGAKLRVIPMNDRGELILEEFAAMLNSRIKIVAVTHLSNSLGTVVPVEQIIQMAHSVGAKVLIDGAQWVAHAPTDVRTIGADFYVFSGHKLFSPTGIGVLYGRRELLDAMPPYQGGGDMIEQVTFGKTTYAPLPSKFEAGTPNIAGAIGLSYGIEYLERLGLDAVRAYERELHAYLDERLAAIKGVRIIGSAEHKASVVSFLIDEPKMSHHDVGVTLDLEGIAVRTGHHCCQPVMDRFGIPGTARASLAMYNTRDDVDALTTALEKIIATARPKAAAKTQATGTIRFPEPAGDSPDAVAEELIDTFAMFDDWKDRYQVIIELGEKLLPMSAEMKGELTKVHGCQSTVHLFARKRPETVDSLDFLADSDADLVRGLIAVLQKVFAGQSSRAILAFDVDGFFKKLGLEDHLSMGRRNGLAGMVQRIRAHANQLVTVSG
jgi:cysteine desulfurase/selenocysteine lyase